MPVTIKDIAEMASVSKGTVSRVLNDAPGVGEETRKRILRLMKELDYQPNASARGLAARRTNNIGLIIPHTGKYSMSNTYWPHIMTAITERAAARDMNVVISTARNERDIDSAYKSILKGRKVDGLIVGGYQFGEKQMAELLLKNFPYVMIGKGHYTSPYHVDVNNADGAKEMTEHLIAQGHQRIAILAGPEQFINIKERIQGFRKAVEAHGLKADLIYHTAYEHKCIVQTVRNMWQSNRPTALFAIASDLAVGTMRALHELKVKIPEELALAFFDDDPFFESFSPTVSAVKQPIETLGRSAVDMLFELMDGRTPAQRSLILPTEIILRESC